MVLPTKSWTIQNSVLFTDQMSQDLQYQEAVFNLANTFKQAGWTVTESSDGTTANTSDNWTAANTLEIGLLGTGAWISLSSPNSATTFPQQAHVLIAMNTTAGTPNSVRIRLSTEAFTGGTTTTVPITVGSLTTDENNHDDIITWNVQTPGTWHSWHTTDGDVMFAVQQYAAKGFNWFFMLNRYTDTSGGGMGSFRFNFFQEQSTTAAGPINIDINQGWRGFDINGLPISTIQAESESWDIAGAWSSGVNQQGTSLESPLYVYDNSSDGRYFGRIVDVYACPTNLQYGVLISDEEGQAQRRMVVGDIWLYVNADAIPLT